MVTAGRNDKKFDVTPATAAYQPDDCDIVADMLAAVADIWPELTASELAAVEARIRDRWGGSRTYVPRNAGEQARCARNEAILRDWRSGERVPLLMRRYRLSERRVWQILRGARAAACSESSQALQLLP